MDTGQMRLALNRFGQNIPLTRDYFEKEYLSKTIRRHERELRTYSLRSFLGVIENRETRAKIGYHKPGWTALEAIEKGLMVLIDGSRLINQKPSQHYLFTQAYSLIMAEINKRMPGNQLDKPVSVVMDEVYSLLSIPGMAEEVGMLAPLYRSRKLQLYIVLQALSQLAINLRKQIWSIGNIVSFGVSDFDEVYSLSQQLFKYVADEVKIPARNETGQPIIEPDRGQYLKIANTIQRLNHRECIMRRFETEKKLEGNIAYIPQTKENPDYPGNVEDLKTYLLRKRGVRVVDALQEINSRTLSVASGTTSVRRSLG
ncbi:hypothetical protein ACFLUA_01400 [Chloroflexota bacterium]